MRPIFSWLMNDTSIEHLLERLPPTATSNTLEARVEADLKLADLFRNVAPHALPERPMRPQEKWRAPLTWGFIGAAAAFVLMSTLSAPVTPPSAIAQPTPQGQESTVSYGARPTPQPTQMQQKRLIDPLTGAEYIILQPAQDQAVMPTKFK
jgi:hypothetical protein